MKEVDLGSTTATESVADLIVEGQKYLGQMKEQLSDIQVPVRIDNPAVLEAINNLLGPQYLNSKGESFITFDMFLQCMVILKNVGRVTAAEYI